MDNSEEKISGFISDKIVQNSEYSKEDILKIQYGMTILIVNISKALAIYLVALLCGVFLQTMIAHIVYCVLRHFNYGFHFENSLVCTIFGIGCFPIAVFIIQLFHLSLSVPILIVASVIFIAITSCFAPSYTTIIVQLDSTTTRLKSCIVTLVLLAINFFSPFSDYSVYIVWGIFISNLLIVINELKRRETI